MAQQQGRGRSGQDSGPNVLGKGDKGHQPGKQIWLLKLKTVRSLGGEGVGQSGGREMSEVGRRLSGKGS